MRKMIEKIKIFLKNLKLKQDIFFKTFKYKSNQEKILFLISFFIQLQLIIFAFTYLNNYNKYMKESEKYKSAKYKLLTNDKNSTINILSLIKNKNNIDHIEFISKNKFITPYIFQKDNNISQYKQMFAYSVSTNIEPLLIDNNISYSWKQFLDKKYLKPELVIPNFVFFDFVEKHFLEILLYSFLIIYLLKNMPSINGSKFDEFQPEDLKNSLNDLAGIDIEIKNELDQLRDLIHNKKDYIKYGINDMFNILFSGPPGVGKTAIAMSLARELSVPIIIGTGNVETGYVGGGPNTIKKLFKRAEILAFNNETKTCIIFLDEAQTLLLKRGGQREKWADDAANELLAQLEGVNSTREVNIIFIAASNFDETNFDMDEAMSRRFKKKIYFRLPDLKERKEIIKLYLDKIDKELIEILETDIDLLAKMFSELSPAKIETIIKEAALLAARNNEKINIKILKLAFERIVVGYTNRDISKEENRKRIIIHELGHFITEYEKYRKDFSLKEIEKKLSIIKISSESISKYGALGYVLNETNDNLKTKKEFEELVISLYGGFAAEDIFYSNDFFDNVSSGPHNDIEKATNLLKKMYFELSFYSNNKLNLNLLKKSEDRKNIEELEAISEKLFNESKRRIEKNKDLIIYLSEILMKEWVLYKEDLFKNIEKFFIENKN